MVQQALLEQLRQPKLPRRHTLMVHGRQQYLECVCLCVTVS